MFVMVPSYVMTVRLLSRRAKFVRNNSLLLTNSAGLQLGAAAAAAAAAAPAAEIEAENKQADSPPSGPNAATGGDVAARNREEVIGQLAAAGPQRQPNGGTQSQHNQQSEPESHCGRAPGGGRQWRPESAQTHEGFLAGGNRELGDNTNAPHLAEMVGQFERPTNGQTEQPANSTGPPNGHGSLPSGKPLETKLTGAHLRDTCFFGAHQEPRRAVSGRNETRSADKLQRREISPARSLRGASLQPSGRAKSVRGGRLEHTACKRCARKFIIVHCSCFRCKASACVANDHSARGPSRLQLAPASQLAASAEFGQLTKLERRTSFGVCERERVSSAEVGASGFDRAAASGASGSDRGQPAARQSECIKSGGIQSSAQDSGRPAQHGRQKSRQQQRQQHQQCSQKQPDQVNEGHPRSGLALGASKRSSELAMTGNQSQAAAQELDNFQLNR